MHNKRCYGNVIIQKIIPKEKTKNKIKNNNNKRNMKKKRSFKHEKKSYTPFF